MPPPPTNTLVGEGEGEGENVGVRLDVIVLDHHAASEILPQVHAVVNPNRQDDLSGLGRLAACGVVFMTLVALARHLRQHGLAAVNGAPDLIGMLDIVALGTVADVVPLTGLNRAFVRQGLKILRRRERPGLDEVVAVVEPPRRAAMRERAADGQRDVEAVAVLAPADPGERHRPAARVSRPRRRGSSAASTPRACRS